MSDSLPCDNFKELLIALKIRRKERKSEYMTVFYTQDYPETWLEILKQNNFKVVDNYGFYKIEYN